ncbi:MAG: 3'-5' exonuclease [Dehalococcoidia bacterium]
MTVDLARPLVFLKVGTTGLQVDRDRIVQLAALKRLPGGEEVARSRLIDPGVAIPPEATAIHGITDEDVAGQPTFRQIARGLAAFLAGCDLAGYNIIRFDLPILEAEFARAGVPFDRPRVVDILTIFRQMEPRTLGAAAQFYLGRDREGDAAADARLIGDLLDAQIERYPGLASKVDALAEVCKPAEWIDSDGRLQWENGVATIRYGRQHRGRPLEEVARTDPGHLDWVIAESNLPHEVKSIMRAARQGRFPVPPVPPEDEPPF